MGLLTKSLTSVNLKNTFCSSPWFHVRITNSGELRHCRWMNEFFPSPTAHIQTDTPLNYFQQGMARLREQFATGQMPQSCCECPNMEQHGKVSGRQRQLLKTGITLDSFEKTLYSSTYWNEFAKDSGITELTPQDWQVELGNYCNSGCVFCRPAESSRLASEFKRIGIKHDAPPANWSDDPVLVERFIDSLVASPKSKYVHFIGGETVITPAFKRILEAMIEHGLHKTVTMGFTTNLTTWPNDIVELTSQFQSVNLGLSIESMTEVNDYVRWPSQIHSVREILQRWVDLAHQRGWLTTLRVTPTALSVHELWTVYQYALENQVNVESCNFLHNPKFMRPTVLPPAITAAVADHLEDWIKQQQLTTQLQIVNMRSPQFRRDATLQDAMSYVNYLRDSANESDLLPDLIQYLKKLESSRGNQILNYLPQYARFFQAAGY